MLTRGAKTISFRLSDYNFHLPKESIALYPADKRDSSRLLFMRKSSGITSHHKFADLTSLLKKGDAIVLNETKVIPARIYGKTKTGGEIEFLATEVRPGGDLKGLVKGLKKLKENQQLDFGNGLTAKFIKREDEFGQFHFNISGKKFDEWLEANGHMPLPPYIGRADEEIDKERYQTVYAKNGNSCAAPTAGLHFTNELLNRFESNGIKVFKINLHVGPGTFRPVTTNDIRDHHLDPEEAEVTAELFDKLQSIKAEGGRVIAVGTTTTRALETAAKKGGSFKGKTALFIYPGFEFLMVDGLITNFHLPQSSLLMLVSALAGKDKVLNAYKEAVVNGYKFYSYGDAMLLLDE